jgi:hypothetical protein
MMIFAKFTRLMKRRHVTKMLNVTLQNTRRWMTKMTMALKTPLEVLSPPFSTSEGVSPKVFGCVHFVHIHGPAWGKLDPRASNVSLWVIFLHRRGRNVFIPHRNVFIPTYQKKKKKRIRRNVFIPHCGCYLF